MSITLSFRCPVEHLRVLQEVVKATNGRFLRHSPALISDHCPVSYVSIEFEESGAYVDFNKGWERVNTKITEVKKPPLWKVMWRKARGRLFK